MTDRPASTGTSRRAFLAASLAAAGVALLDPRALATARARAAALPAGDLFPLGVASGDPTATSVILWTRLISPDASDLGADIAVDWEIATDDAFGSVVAAGTAPAVAALAHSVHVDATGLTADTTYWYRFSVDGRTSPTGRTKTFPGAGVTPAQVRLGLCSCQNWSDGYYTAHAALATEDLDVVLFVGDYIYERPKSSGPRPSSLPESVDLATYRARYELYKGDANLQAAHAAFAWIITMDDHEVANDVLGDNGKDGEDAGDPAAIAAYRARRGDAFQAWYEHQPLRLPAPTSPDYVLHRTVEHSDLVRFFVLDGRQYRSLYPANESVGGDIPERRDPSRSMLGSEQETWLDGQFAATTARWNVIAQQTVMTATPIGARTAPIYNFDQWDGYVASRKRLLQSLVDHQVRNPLVLSGDIHLAGAASIRMEEDDDAPDIANEIVCTSISSRFEDALTAFFDDMPDLVPWIRYVQPRYRGYSVVTITPERATTEFRAMATTAAPTSAVTTDFTDVIEDREPVQLPIEETTTTTTTTSTTSPQSTEAPAAVPVSGEASYTG